MADMTGMHQIEHTVAHDNGLFARALAHRLDQLVDRLDLVSVFAGKLSHAGASIPNSRTRCASPWRSILDPRVEHHATFRSQPSFAAPLPRRRSQGSSRARA